MRAALLIVVLLGCRERSPLTQPENITDCNLDSDCSAVHVCTCDRCNARNRNVHAHLCPGAPCKVDACAGARAVCVQGTCEIEKR